MVEQCPSPPHRRRQRSWLLWALLFLGILGVIVGTVFAVGVLRPLPPLVSLQTIVDIPLHGGSSRLDYQSFDPRTQRLFIAHLGASTVSVFDVKANKIIADIPNITGVHGVLAIPELGRVYASATGENQITVIDEQTLHVVVKIPGGVYPDGMAYDSVDHKLFVSDETGQTDTVIDTQTEQRVATIALGGDVGNTQYDPISHLVFVDVQTRNQVIAINPVTNRIIARYDLPGCASAHSLLLDSPQRLAFVACDGNGKLLMLALSSMKVLSVESVGSAPDVLALDSGWHVLYVASESGVVSVFDEQKRTLHKLQEGFVATEAHTVAVDEGTHRIYLPLENVNDQPVLRIALFHLPVA